MSKVSINLIISIVFAVATIAGFGWLWMSSNQEVTTTASSTGNYAVVTIDKEKTQATELLASLQVNSEIPFDYTIGEDGEESESFK